MEDKINLDDRLDYRALYSGIVRKAQISGDSMTGCCPVHNDDNPSFSVDLKTGKCTCFSCGYQGNYVSLYATIHDMDTKTAYKAILRENGLERTPEAKKKPSVYTVSEYCLEKRFDKDWLQKTTGMEKSGTDKDGTPWIRIPYYDEQHKEVLFRKRYPKGAACRFKWGYGSAGKLCLYGEWTLPEARDAGYAIMVEGESDTQTLWLLGMQALGVPGASTYKPAWTPRLEGLKLYLHIEPDHGGQVFLEQMTRKLRDGEFLGEVYTWSCSQFGVKDPSDLYIKYGAADAADKIKQAIAGAKIIHLDNLQDEIPVAIKDAPINLRQPAGWIYDEHGIQSIDEKTAQPAMVCRTPIIITKRLKVRDTGEEKIEIAFKRDGAWKSAVFSRPTVFVSRNITDLSKLGCTITSENAKHVVSFLSALEAENIDLIETVSSTTSFGWQQDGKFLPWHADEMVLDVHQSMQRWASAYTKQGSLDNWIKTMAPHRARYRFQFILAASFAAPLLRIIKQRIFFVYNWGGSRGGKTAALKAALSAWGDPERLMANFNATQVALERMAGFYCDLPLGIDERQLAGSKQEGLEKVVYMIANGTGRGRGAKDGGLQELKTWRTVAIATGEEPIGRTNSMTGVSTRVIEVIGGPFDKEADAAEMHQAAGENTGWAGDAFIGHLMATGDAQVVEWYKSVYEPVKKMTGEKNGSHTAGIAAVTLADFMIAQLFFGEAAADARAHALDMAEKIVGDLEADEVPDVNVSAAEFIADWINMFQSRNFGPETMGPCYGDIDGTVAYIYPTPLREALEKGGFSYRKTVKWLKDSGAIIGAQGSRTTITKWVLGKTARVIAIDMKTLDGATSHEETPPVAEFQEISPDEPLPF